MVEEEGESAPKKRRLQGKQAAPSYGPPLALPVIVVVGGAAFAGQARRQKACENCPGKDGETCSWSSSRLGEPARIHPPRSTHCLFCSDAQLDKILAQKRSGFQLTKNLTDLRELSESKYESALENLRGRKGNAFAADFAGRVDLAIYHAVERQRAPSKTVPERWADLLQRRARFLDDEALENYEAQARRDRMMIRRKVFCPKLVGKRYSRANEEAEAALTPLPAADIAPNDSGLPAPTLTERAKMAELWCKHGSWQICESCSSMRPRPFQPVDLRSVRQPTIKKCLLCRRGVYVPQPDDIPESTILVHSTGGSVHLGWKVSNFEESC